MKIRRIKLHNFAGVEDAEITFPNEGITVIEGVNEAGKTSLIEAVDALLAFQDSSSHRAIKAAVPAGRDVGPEAEVEFTAGAYEFTYRKRWVRDKETVLDVTKPDREQLTGREAHDRVREILDEAVDVELWQALRLDQGNALGQADFEVSALGRALDAAAGGDVAGDHEDALWDRVEEEYGKYWTSGGKSRGDFAKAKDRLATAREQSEAAETHLRKLDEDADDVRRLEIAAVSLEQAQLDAAETAKDLAEQVAAVERIRESVEQAQVEHDRASAVFLNAQRDLERRNEQIEALDEAKHDLETAIAEVNRAAPEREGLAEEAARAGEAYAKARSASDAAEGAYNVARSDSEFRRQQIEIEQLTERRDRVEEAQRQLEQAEEDIESITVDDELLSEIEDAHLELAKVRATADRALPSVEVEALGQLEVEIDDEDVELDVGGKRSITVHNTARIRVPGVIDISIVAGIDGADVATELEEAANRYAELCQRGNVSGFAEARVQADQRGTALRAKADAVGTVERDLRDLTFDALTGKIDRLIQRTAEFGQLRATEPPIPADLTEAQEVERAAEQEMAEARSASERTDALRQEATANLNQFDVEDAHLNARFQLAESAADSAKQTLEVARSARSDADLELAAETAASVLKVAEAGVGAAREQLAAADPETLEALLANADAAKIRSAEELQSNEDRRRELEIKLALETERGPAQFADEAKTNLVEAESRFERLSSRAAATRLLHNTLLTHRQAARQRYNQPFRDQIERLGRIVFGPTFEVTLDDELAIESRTLEGTTLGFGQLSTGAQEQLGLLARLACAALVAPEGGAPVIFDDALGWTDPGRLDRMGAAISTVADDCQVIILTCVPDRYAGVGKARVVVI